MSKRHYSDFFTVPENYKPNMTREAIDETLDTWLDFYPHQKYQEFLKTLMQVLNGGLKSIWLTGNFGTGKSNAALVTLKLFMDDEKRVRKWFNDNKGKIKDHTTLLSDLFTRRQEGTLVLYDYNASGLGPNEDFLVRLEQGIIVALSENGMFIPAKANLGEIIERVLREDKHFFEMRDSMQSELAYLHAGIKTAEQLAEELKKAALNSAVPTYLLGDVQKVLHRDGIYLDINVNAFRRWIKEILSLNNLKRIVYIFDEFSGFIDANKEHLKTFEEAVENPGINKFFFIPVTHLSINAYWAEASESAKKANDRFHFRNLQMPNDTAFKLAAHAMKPNLDLSIAEEWEREKMMLWESVRDLADSYFKSEDVDRELFYAILPIHPMAAFLLKHLSESARSNQRSIFEYLKGSADGQEFQDFIRTGGPGIQSRQFLTVDYLWKYFIERDDLGISKEIIEVRSEFERIKSREFQNKDENDEDIRVLKATLLFCLLSRLLTSEAHERLQPTIENITLSFKGDGMIAGVEGIIESLAEKHCFSLVGGNIEMFSTSVGNADLEKKRKEHEKKFHELLSTKTEEKLKEHRKGDVSKFSFGRFDFRVSDVEHTTLTNIAVAVREKYSSGQNNDGTVCLWFVAAKDSDEQRRISVKIENILKQLYDHRIMFITFPTLTFCDTNRSAWSEYVEQYAKYELENNASAKTQCKRALERIENEWFEKIRGTKIKVFTTANREIVVNDSAWISFREILGDYVRRTLPCCVDYLTEQATAFGIKGLQAWAAAGINFETAAGPHKQLIEAFKEQEITASDSWFEHNADHSIAQIRTLFDKKIAESVDKGIHLSVCKVYIELKRSPYGLKSNALSAFVLGIALRHLIGKNYRWDNLQQTGELDLKSLAEIIEYAVSESGKNKEKRICRLSPEEKAFIEKAPMMFGIKGTSSNMRVEDVLLQIQNRIAHISGRVPLWALPKYIYSTNETSAELIDEALKNICLAGSASSKSDKIKERSAAVKRVGRLILDNDGLVDKIAAYIKSEYFVLAFQIHVKDSSPDLVSLAEGIGDISYGYCQAILDKVAETAGLLWNEVDISKEIFETVQEYKIIKLLKTMKGFTDFISYKSAFEILLNAVAKNNKLPKTLLDSAVPTLSLFLSTIKASAANNGTLGSANEIRGCLEENYGLVKELFFDASRSKSVDLLKRQLGGIEVSLDIYNSLPSGFLQEEGEFLNSVLLKIEEFAKESVVLKIKNEWIRLTSAESPSTWANANGIPARFAISDVSEAADIIRAVETPKSFSTDKLTELLSILEGLLPLSIKECQDRFFAETVPSRFTKFNINLSSILDHLKRKYGNQPNNWPEGLDIDEFIRNQYKGVFAPQITEKIRNTSAEELKTLLLRLAQDNPDLGLLFWEI